MLTNKDVRFTGPLLAAHGLTQFFDDVVSGDAAAHMKPAPDGLLSCLRWRLNVRCSLATLRWAWRPPEMLAFASGPCGMATTWASQSPTATLTA